MCNVEHAEALSYMLFMHLHRYFYLFAKTNARENSNEGLNPLWTRRPSGNAHGPQQRHSASVYQPHESGFHARLVWKREVLLGERCAAATVMTRQSPSLLHHIRRCMSHVACCVLRVAGDRGLWP